MHVFNRYLNVFQGVHEILSAFGGSVVQALLAAFPNIGFDSNKFKSAGTFTSFFLLSSPIPSYLFTFSVGEWSDEDRRREVFAQFARDHNFEPLNPDMWYSQSKEKLLSHQVPFHHPSLVFLFSFLFFSFLLILISGCVKCSHVPRQQFSESPDRTVSSDDSRRLASLAEEE